MQVIESFESRCVAYQEQSWITKDTTALSMYLQSHNLVYSQIDYMLPEHPPSVEMLAIMVKDVCRGEPPYDYVFEQTAQRYIDLVGDIGISTQVIFYYISNVVISLLVLKREHSQLSSEILIKIIQRFDFRDAILRAGVEVIAEQVLRRCYVAINESNDGSYV